MSSWTDRVDALAIAAGVAFGLMWASAFTSARVIVQYAPPLTALSLRFLISGLLGVLLARALGQSWRLTPPQWRATIVFGVCQNALYLGVNFVAMQSIEASLAAIIASSMPLFVGLAGWALFSERLSPLGVAGLMAGMLGVGLVMGTRLSGGADGFGVLLCIIGVISLTIATLAVRGASSGGNFLMVVGLQMLVGSVVLFVPAAALESWQFTPSWQLTVAFAYTTLVPGLAATLVWFWLVNRIGAVRAAVFHFLTPFFGVSIAAVLLGEALSIWDVLGVLVITAGILAVQVAKQRPTGT